MTAKMNDSAQRLIALRQGIINEIWQSPRYKQLIEELRARRPKVPYWTPAHIRNGVLVPDNTPEMQAASAAQKWHDVMMSIIDPESYPNEGGK